MNNYLQYVSINPDIRFGKPTITGTRITVGDILGWLAAGMTKEKIFDDHPYLRKEHIKAALAFAAHREALAKIVAG